MWWFWQCSTNWRGRRTFDVIGKRDPLLKRRGALGWLSRCCTDEPAFTHTHTHAHKHTNTHARVHLPRMHTFYSCLYFPLNYPQKENQWCRNFSRVSFGFVGVHRRELMWPSERGCSMTKGGGVSGSFRSYLLPQYTSATLLLLCKVDVGKTK